MPENSSILTHFDASGQAHMVNISAKPPTERVARASGLIAMQPSTLELIVQGQAGKGDVLGIARIAAIMAAKKTSDIIPLCHPIALSHVHVDFQPQPASATARAHIHCWVEARSTGSTGVEMEAMTAVSAALLTIYDMCKAADRGMEIGHIQLLEKSGGKSGHWLRENQNQTKPTEP